MDGSSVIALFLARNDDTATSALPQAPKRIRARKPGLSRWSVLRGRRASALHRLAWAIERDKRGIS
ncbi:hypothetical protein ARTSIC4J27_346 [Pseudarthrobacter siccitolerans]|uniref:Uncharacterized protein n=1 Tax=Pseudarthrobacter siccitolerans TaxID=861266 RepID=A0A024GWU2_9MICC|nr:hypothetical protein [Pseudarthrobacter siccitolerans]CCQ44420.1 hypothetical protein ARTSIC4J27_346 [Pseudarthrobacter siccitolerans]